MPDRKWGKLIHLFSAMVKEVILDPTQGSFTPLPEWNNPSSLNTVDWQDALYRNGLKQNYNLSGRGGGEKVLTGHTAVSCIYYCKRFC